MFTYVEELKIYFFTYTVQLSVHISNSKLYKRILNLAIEQIG